MIKWLDLDLFISLFVYVVITKPNGPDPNSEFEHSSIPATIKKLLNLSSSFLTRRDAWAGTFDHIVTELASPRTDCPGNHQHNLFQQELKILAFYNI